jgi:hypothetical protein
LNRSLKRKLAIGLAALLVAALAGGAYAATQSSGPTSRQAFLNDVAKRLHVTPQQLTSALNGAYLDQLQAAVNAGKLTQAQANALEQRLKQKKAVPALPFGLFGPRGRLAPWRLAAPGFPSAGPGQALNAAAGYLGLSKPQLVRDLAGGKSLAEVATAEHKSLSGLEQAMTTAQKTRLDKLVAAKIITAAQEQKMLSRFSARLSQEVNQKGLPFRWGPRLPHGVPTLPAPPGARLPGGPVPPPTA